VPKKKKSGAKIRKKEGPYSQLWCLKGEISLYDLRYEGGSENPTVVGCDCLGVLECEI